MKLQERKNACLRADYASSEQYAAQFLAFTRSDPVVRTIVVELDTIAERLGDPMSLVNANERRLQLPRDRDECAAFFLRLMERLADPNPKMAIPGFHFVFGGGSNKFQDMTDDFYEQVLQPLCAYIDERIDDGDLLLYMLSRYQRECAWFEGDALAELVAGTDSRNLENALDQHLRSWLFREGIDYPFSTPRSPSGRADVIVWHGEEPLAIEVKVFDGENRDTGHVKQGLWQAFRYAADYSKPFGYLVTFNTSGAMLTFDGASATGGPPCLAIGDRSVFAITLDVAPARPSASKEKPVKTHVVQRPEA